MDHVIDMAEADPAMMRFRTEKENERKALRDQFAMAAMQGLIYCDFIQQHIPDTAYEIADAMMKAREKE